MTVETRCSRVPLFFACSQSIFGEISVESSNRDAADLGNGIHELVMQWIPAERMDFSQVAVVASRLRLDPEELGTHARITFFDWVKTFSRFFPKPKAGTERLVYEEDGVRLTGTPDLYCPPESLGADEIRVADFKSGWGDNDARDQFRGYAFLLLKTKFPEAKRAQVCEIRTRDRTLKSEPWYDRGYLEQWWRGLIDRTRDKAFRPGRHCAYCPRGPSCEAKSQLVRQSVLTLLGDKPNGVLSTGDVHRLYEAAKTVEKAVKDALEIVRVHVMVNGDVTLPGGEQALTLTQNSSRKLTFPDAMPLLRKEFGEELDAVLRCGLKDVEKLVVRPRGQKAAAVRELVDRLTNAGVIASEVVEKLEVRKIHQDKENHP